MKGYTAALLAALMLMGILVSGAAAQDVMRLYVQEGAMDQAQAQRLLLMLNEEEAQWAMTGEGQTLRELVLTGNAPDLAICSPQAARPWAKEGLLVPLSTHIADQKRMQRQVVDLCVYEEELFMAPLIARHRQMAVNRRVFEEIGLDYMLDSQTYPVWYPAQFYQILEEFMIRDRIAVDVWHAQADTSAALEALTQAIYGGELLSEDGRICRAGEAGMIAGMQWLGDSIETGMIGLQATREAALERFLTGETAIWIDWTPALEKQLAGTIQESGMEIAAMAYPSAMGLPVRSFDVFGVCAFLSGEAAKDAQLRRACAQLHAAAQDVLGPRGIWQDGALWPASLDADDAGTTLRSLFCEAFEEVIQNGKPAEAALLRVQAAMDALGQTK